MGKDISKKIIQAAEGLARAARNSKENPSANFLKINTMSSYAESSTKLDKNGINSGNPE